MKFCSCSFS